MDQSGSTGSEAPQPPATPQTPPPAAPAPTTAWAPPPPVVQAGPAGFVYADVPNRAIAYIIDAIVLAIINIIVGIVLAAVGLSVLSGLSYNFAVGAIFAVIALIISGGYFIYTWTVRRGTIGMQVLGMQIGNAVDGKTMTTEQGIRRWLALGAPFSIAQVFNPFPTVGILIGLLALIWFFYLLYSTWQSPTKQGFHDVFANTMVVKATRVAG